MGGFSLFWGGAVFVNLLILLERKTLSSFGVPNLSSMGFKRLLKSRVLRRGGVCPSLLFGVS